MNYLKSIVVAFMFAALFYGCKSDEMETIGSENLLSLVAPNGEMIATSVDELRQEVKEFISEGGYGEDFPFTLTDIEYFPISDGYLALICYELADGIKSNYAKSNSMQVLASSNISVLHIDSAFDIDAMSYNKDGSVTLPSLASTRYMQPAITFVCKSASGCIPCQVRAAVVGDETTVDCTESCPDCKLEVKIKG